MSFSKNVTRRNLFDFPLFRFPNGSLRKSCSTGIVCRSPGGRRHSCDTSHNDERSLIAKETAPLSWGEVRRRGMTIRSALVLARLAHFPGFAPSHGRRRPPIGATSLISLRSVFQMASFGARFSSRSQSFRQLCRFRENPYFPPFSSPPKCRRIRAKSILNSLPLFTF